MTEEYTVGTCGNCGGPVRMPAIWHGVKPPPKRCAWCGAEARDFGPVIPMAPERPSSTRTPHVSIKDKRYSYRRTDGGGS